uniref:Uncharacterized protein n=1 Tax=Rhodnius prolixus TaxID=13249 RepID=T1IDZ6_RHOPR
MSYGSVLVVLLVACYGGASVFSGMTGQLGRALQRLARAGPEPYKLMPGLTLAPTAHWNHTRPTAHPRGPTLIESVTDVLRTHRLQWKVAPGLQVSLLADDKGMFRVQAGSDNAFQDSSRTFGMMRRMKLALLPIMYKLGVITTLLVLLTAFALKGLTIGIL